MVCIITIKVVCVRVRPAKPRSTVLYTLQLTVLLKIQRSSQLPSFLYTGFFIPTAVFDIDSNLSLSHIQKFHLLGADGRPTHANRPCCSATLSKHVIIAATPPRPTAIPLCSATLSADLSWHSMDRLVI